MKPLKSASDIRDLVTSFKAAEVVNTAFDMGVFAAIASNGPMTLDQLSDSCEAFPRSLEILLNACIALGLLTLTPDNKYENTPLSVSTLTPGSDHFLGNFIRLQRDVRPRWDLLRYGVEYNRRVNPEKRAQENGSESGWNRKFVLGLHDSARLAASSIAQALAPIFAEHNVKKVVDVGGGSGTYSAALVSQIPDLHASVLDLPGPLAIAGEIWLTFKHRDRLELLPTDFHAQPIGAEGEYDAALLFGVLHSESENGQIELLQKISHSLKPGGLLVLRTPYLYNTRTGPLRSTLDSLQTLISTDSGKVPTLRALKATLRKGGFSKVRVQRVPGTEVQLLLCHCLPRNKAQVFIPDAELCPVQ